MLTYLLDVGLPFDLVPDSPAGGAFRPGESGEHTEIDAIDHTRTPTGRRPGNGVLSHPLPV